MLVAGLTIRSNKLKRGSLDIFKMLRENENNRIFWVFAFITVKIILTYVPITQFDALALTHGVDSLRSVIVYWAIKREHDEMKKTAMKAKKGQKKEEATKKEILASDNTIGKPHQSIEIESPARAEVN